MCFPALAGCLIGREGALGSGFAGGGVERKGWAGWLIRRHSVQSKAVGNQQEPT
ncbi:MAG TPA: hypothetical protein PLX18_09670 [Anaerohalosphaeraceae bacterium]|nr:hypothetical protein [Anaerohalosphaeraceae bacterium]HOT73511.1 hypothetical protein [Anaerohalosphaeraceae bacterium]HPB93370.1 hypothetical protein [Anaerohalosphaeraceae bacterium]HQG06595.1 hypothetical protein [Anaerohalosphaeraceae bacterium]HQI08106.1 hypothetical protein [Anaerohalosphaeraceae bacterium]